MLVIACAADCKKGYFSRLESKASQEALFIFHKLEPFSWAAMIDWEFEVGRAHRSDIVCFVDAWDFIMQGSAADVTNALGTHDLLFHSEAICWPEPHKADRFPAASTRFRYVNGTGPCGYGDAIADAIDYGRRNFPIRGFESSMFSDCDQRFLADVFLSGRGAIDYECKLSVSLNAVEPDEFEVKDGKLVLSSGITPAFVHANGMSGKLYADRLEKIR